VKDNVKNRFGPGDIIEGTGSGSHSSQQVDLLGNTLPRSTLPTYVDYIEKGDPVVICGLHLRFIPTDFVPETVFCPSELELRLGAAEIKFYQFKKKRRLRKFTKNTCIIELFT